MLDSSAINNENLELNTGTINESEVTEKIKNVRKKHSELIQISNFIVKKHISKIDSEGSRDVLRAAFPSFILLLISLFIDVSYVPFLGKVANNFASYLFPGSSFTGPAVDPISLWWLPFLVFGIFVLTAYLSNRTLKKQISIKGPSNEVISRIIDSYSGMVDSLSTAMPLLGAAILLVSIKEGPSLFIGFSVPFEIKSIVILAIGKLFNSVFETQALQFQSITEEVNNFEKEYNYYSHERNHLMLIDNFKRCNDELISSISASGIKGINKEDAELIFKYVKLTSEIIQKSAEFSAVIKENISAINNMKIPDLQTLEELKNTSKILNETLNGLKENSTLKSLDNLAYLAGKR